ncbi:MAG: hypothetical protein U9Q16_01050 [Patescibacteria group bacterium]|nr:hypothetical protein [Patescibacteria group bacterium]
MDEIQNTTGDYESDLGSSSIPPSHEKSSTGLVIKIVIGVVLIASIATGIILDTKIWDPSWNPFRENAEKNVEKMIDKMMEVKTMHYDMKIEMDAINESLIEESFKMTITAEGDSDQRDKENPKSSEDFDVIVSAEGMEFNLAGEVKSVNKNNAYFKLNTMPMIPGIGSLFMALGLNVNEIKGKWIKIEQDDSNEAYDIDKLTKLSKGFEEKIKEIIVGEKAYYVKETLNSEKIGGQNMYHYILSPNKESIKKIVFEYVEVIFGLGEITMSAEERQELEGGVDKFLEKSGGVDIEVWIGKSDDYLYRIKFEKDIDASVVDEGSQNRLIVKFDMNMSDFNKPVKIEAPEDFVEFNDLFNVPSYDDYYQLENDYPLYYPESYKDDDIIQNLMYLMATAALIHDEKNEYTFLYCAYDEETWSFCNDIIDAGGNPIIHSSVNEYCMYSLLNEGDYYCIDNKGHIGKTTSKPIACNGTTFVCPNDLE